MVSLNLKKNTFLAHNYAVFQGKLMRTKAYFYRQVAGVVDENTNQYMPLSGIIGNL